MSDTPRTDAATNLALTGSWVRAEHARILERELLVANGRVKELEAQQAWRPIETAPTSGPEILAARRHTDGVDVIWPGEADDQASDGSTFYSHWMPRPAPPKQQGKATP